MNFTEFIQKLDEYLQAEKVFIENPTRLADVKYASSIASRLFQDATITLKNNELQTGAIVVCIESFDFIVRGAEEIQLFKKLISKADNFEIYAKNNEDIVMSIMFQGALTRVKP